MRARLLVLLWLVVAALVWNVVFDLHVSLGVRTFLRLVAEARLGEVPEPSLREMMAASSRGGATAATIWALVVFLSGCLTLYAARKRPA